MTRQSIHLINAAVSVLVFVNGSKLAAQEDATKPRQYYVLMPDNSLVSLALESGTTKTKSKGGVAGMMVGMGMKGVSEIPGPRAAVRIKSTGKQIFVLGADGPLPDPLPMGRYANMVKFEPNKEKTARDYFMVGTTGGPFLGKAKIADMNAFPLDISKHATHSFSIEPRTPLPPGEVRLYVIKQ